MIVVDVVIVLVVFVDVVVMIVVVVVVVVEVVVVVGVVVMVGAQVGDFVVLVVVTFSAVGKVSAGGRMTDAVVKAIVITLVVGVA